MPVLNGDHIKKQVAKASPVSFISSHVLHEAEAVKPRPHPVAERIAAASYRFLSRALRGEREIQAILVRPVMTRLIDPSMHSSIRQICRERAKSVPWMRRTCSRKSYQGRQTTYSGV